MKLKKYHCEEFSLRFRTDRSNFAERRFFRDPRISDFFKDWEKGEPLNLTYSTADPRSSDFHGHARFTLARSIVSVQLRWVEGSIKKSKDARPPFADELFPWVNRFFAPNVYNAFVTASYSFPRSRYDSRLALPWVSPPFLPVSSKLRKRPRMIVGMTMREIIRGASRATFEIEEFEGEALWVMIRASYKEKLVRLAPDNILPEFDKIVGEYIFKR